MSNQKPENDVQEADSDDEDNIIYENMQPEFFYSHEMSEEEQDDEEDEMSAEDSDEDN